ncbi:MAG: hypothetical protein RL154_725 [Pseudomonadota bacterium]|jgi:chemotaxis protein CheC
MNTKKEPKMATELSELQKDFLTEIINIAYGKATARIAQILDAFATMNVPNIKYVTKVDLCNEISLKKQEHGGCYLSIQTFVGKFDGETIFLLGEDSAQNLIKHLGNAHEFDNTKDSIIELTNIVTALLITEMANNLDTEVYFNEPSFQEFKCDNVLQETLTDDYEHIIAIDTVMEFKEQKIIGHVYILTHNKSFKWLTETLDEKIKELGL